MKIRIFSILCCILISNISAIPRRVSTRGRNNQGVRKTSLVVQIDTPEYHKESVPELAVYFNGNRMHCDDNGFAHFLLDEVKKPEKWYLLITKRFNPSFADVNTLQVLKTMPEKECLYYALKWEEKPRQWTIVQKDLTKKNLEIPKPEQCVIVNLHPRYVASVGGSGDTAVAPQMHENMVWLPRIVLKDVQTKPLERESRKSLLGAMPLHPIHQQVKRMTQDSNTGRTPVRVSLPKQG